MGFKEESSILIDFFNDDFVEVVDGHIVIPRMLSQPQYIMVAFPNTLLWIGHFWTSEQAEITH